MIAYDLDHIADVAAAPTTDSIERQRQQQLLAVKTLRRLLSRQFGGGQIWGQRDTQIPRRTP